jgi:hypothetical protein
MVPQREFPIASMNSMKPLSSASDQESRMTLTLVLVF